MHAKLDMIGIVVADMARSFVFYQLLGLEIPQVAPDEDYAEITLPGGIRLSWNSVSLAKQLDPDWVEPRGMRMGLAFLCESPSAVDELYHQVREAGFGGHKEPWDAFWGQRYAQLLDPDGNVVDLFALLSHSA